MPFRDRGSLWGRWDLHFHTPTSFDYKNGSVTNEQIVEGLQKAGVSAVAITDHHVIDVPRIRALQKLAGHELTVLPGIEFRTELGGKEKVHLIGIFPEDVNLDELWTKLSGKLEITPEDVKKKTHEAIYVDFKEAAELIRNLGGIVTTHAGGKSNSIENIGNNTVSAWTMAGSTSVAEGSCSAPATRAACVSSTSTPLSRRLIVRVLLFTNFKVVWTVPTCFSTLAIKPPTFSNSTLVAASSFQTSLPFFCMARVRKPICRLVSNAANVVGPARHT